MFPPIAHREWMRGRPEVALYDLGSTELRGDRADDPAPVPEPLADLSDPPAGVGLHTLLATVYGVEPEQVLVTAGAAHADFLAAAVALADAEPAAVAGGEATPGGGGRALVEAPGYEPLVRTPEGFGAAVDRFRRGASAGYALDPERMREGLDADTRLVTVTNRHNPSGRLADRDTLADAAAVAREGGARLLVDEVYAPYVAAEDAAPASEAGTAFGGPTAAGVEGVAVTGSLTKFHGLGPVNVGWLVADEAFVAAARRVKDHVPAVAGTGVALAERALHNADALADRSRALLEANAARLSAFVADRPDVAGPAEPGSTFAFLDPAAADGDAAAAAAWEAGLLVVPGRFFGDPGRVRVSLGRDAETAEAGLRTLAAVLDGLA